MQEDAKLLFETSDPRGYSVTLSREQYFNHILKSENHISHNEFSPEEIKECIESPRVISQSEKIPSRDLYFSKTSARYPSLFLETVVDMDEERKAGEVVTAYLTKKVNGGKEGGLRYVNIKSEL